MSKKRSTLNRGKGMFKDDDDVIEFATMKASTSELNQRQASNAYGRISPHVAESGGGKSQTHGTIPLMERDLTPREKVIKALRLFKMIFMELYRDPEARRSTRPDHDARLILKNQNMCVNTEYIIGEVPGIRVGDSFDYKAEMSVVGLHFALMSGVDYLKTRRGRMLATSIVASEGTDYNNVFMGDQLLYCGIGKDQTSLEKGNRALMCSMKQNSPVRVTRGYDLGNGKTSFVYQGLYVVETYWVEERAAGKRVFRFKLRRKVLGGGESSREASLQIQA
ncbi:unnamed protein product [Eruca vesicaria subsp. sativa]|uniref:YDG domain-containing protein n=1 Tax=Eruca vesicaria subsp. sativa TaxID=29727 RepID=A0ABC8LXU3_ERUVS|nr:unnamed protein product [Eruca vesicaria subsp. sativa]